MAKDDLFNKDSNARDWLPARIIIAAIGLVFLGFIIFGDRSNCGIDKVTLACRWSGSAMDIIGTIVFLAGAAWLAGLGDKFYVSEGKGTFVNAIIGFIACIIGVALIWNM